MTLNFFLSEVNFVQRIVCPEIQACIENSLLHRSYCDRNKLGRKKRTANRRVHPKNKVVSEKINKKKIF